MELKVICKRLITQNLDGNITEGEYGADVIGISVPRTYGNHDLSAFSFRLSAISKHNESIAEQVLTMDSVDEKNIHLLWKVTSDFTAVSGEVTLILAGVNNDNTVQIKFISQPVTINDDYRFEFIESPTILEQAYNQVQLEVQKAIDAAERAEEASLKPAVVCTATETEIGGVLSGGDIDVNVNGNVTVNSVSGKTVGTSVPENAVFTDTIYTLPTASDKVLGGVKIDNKTIEIDADGIISAVGGINVESVKLLSDNNLYTITDTVQYPLISLNLYGKSIQDGTPTPENPIDIVSTGDNGTVEIIACGKNLLDVSSANTGDSSSLTINENGFRINAKDGSTRVVTVNCKLIEGKTYHLSCQCNIEGTECEVKAYATDENGKVHQYAILNTTFTARQSWNRIVFYIDAAYMGNNVYFEVANPQLELGTTATSFEAYKDNTAIITSGLPLYSVGNVRDELIYNADGTGKIIKRTAKLESYNGEEIITDFISSTGGLDLGATIVYVLATPQVVELSATEMAELQKLQTFDGITNIYNDNGAEMAVKICTNKDLSDCVYPLIKNLISKINE
ncbi:MAG: hypothetical protein J6K17_13965 [Oscillospiraceae bacterium]|nr:hypothetical protein [Oscillospiraceae bacterium]